MFWLGCRTRDVEGLRFDYVSNLVGLMIWLGLVGNSFETWLVLVVLGWRYGCVWRFCSAGLGCRFCWSCDLGWPGWAGLGWARD